MNTNLKSPDDGRTYDAPGRIDGITQVLGIIALIGFASIIVICLTVQFLRTDANWITTTMSIYVRGRWGTFVQASFFAPAPGIAAVGVGWYRSLNRRARSPLPLALFMIAAVALCVMAANVADPTQHPVTLHGEIHQWAAFATFVCITFAMLLQSLRLRFDMRWRKIFPGALAVALIAIVYFWVYALFKPIPRGLGEKVVIGLVLLWLWRAAWWLVRGRTLGH